MTRRPASKPGSLDLPGSFREVLGQSEPRPPDDGDRKDKKNYAERLSNRIAVWLAERLRGAGAFHGMLPNRDGSARETKVASGPAKKFKKTDVRYGTADTGLELLVSVKTLSFRDTKRNKRTGMIEVGRYTRNIVRNDHELRAEAMDLHERFPYAVLVGILFLPWRACDDGQNDKSSFAHAVMTLRPRAGRNRPADPDELFERLFIGLYEHLEPRRGDVMFFDVTTNPPRRARPQNGLIDADALIREIVKAYGIRNRRYIEWADAAPGVEAPLLEPTDGAAEAADDEPEETDA